MKSCPQCRLRYPVDTVFCFVDGCELTAIRDPLIGAKLAGRYVVEDLLGEGGMATVYRARYELVDRPCAIKVLNSGLSSDANLRERFRREAKSTQALGHPNVIEIFDQGETDDGIPYIVMELLEGLTLSTLIDEGPVAPRRAVPIMLQIARGIARAHDLGVVHRDLKPDNIFVCSRVDGSDLVKILDFGIARSRNDTRLTHAGELFGTPQYMAPERILSGEAGPSVDLYALGVIFFEIATARLPFEAGDPASYLAKHIKEQPPAPRSFEAHIPEQLDALIMQLLEKEPHARPVDAHRIEKDLAALARKLGAPLPPEPEADPASSRPPAHTLPGLVLDEWVRRVELFERMLSRAYAAAVPIDQKRRLSELSRLVRDFADVRDASAKEQRALEQIDTRGREGRQRFGFAVDATGLDASKAKDDLRGAKADLERIEQESRSAAEAYAEAQRELLTWEGRSGQTEPHSHLARAYRACAEAVEAWLSARKREGLAQTRAENEERTVSDLEFQIGELRAALANHERSVDRLLELAAELCSPLRTRPELGELFGSLESPSKRPGSA